MNKPFICSVLSLDIVEYPRKSVAEQIASKARLNALVAEAINDVAANNRVVLETTEGVALIFLGNPEDALFVTMGLGDAAAVAPPLQLRFGINLGPVRVVKDVHGQPNIIGDGINVAQRVMGFAQPGQILASRSYYEVVSRVSEAYAQLMHYEGTRTDEHVREHEVYSVASYGATHGMPLAPFEDMRKQRSDSVDSGTARVGSEPAATVSPPGSFQVESVVAEPARVEAEPAPVQKPNPQVAVGPRSGIGKKLGQGVAALAVVALLFFVFVPGSDETLTEPESSAPADTVEPPKPVELATLRLAITPWGEVYVDGQRRGVSPPLRLLKLSPGKHKIEIKNASFKGYNASIDLKTGAEVTVKHKFR
ncbi:MAG: PEGA domain-containing protein [Burkholderiales bacterium]